MVPFLLTAREHHGVADVAQLRRRHRQALAHKARHGMRYQVHTVTQAVEAFVSAGSWVVLCPACQSGCATDPRWGVACCFGCGAEYTQVVFPVEVASIERVLLERPAQFTRNWQRPETVAALQAENNRYLPADRRQKGSGR